MTRRALSATRPYWLIGAFAALEAVTFALAWVLVR